MATVTPGRQRSARFINSRHALKPANLPVELPQKFWLAINLKAAKQLGLDIAQTGLTRAERLIE